MSDEKNERDMDWHEELYTASHSINIVQAAGHLAYRQVHGKPCPVSELPTVDVLVSWIREKGAWPSSSLAKSLGVAHANWWIGEIKGSEYICALLDDPALKPGIPFIHQQWREQWDSWNRGKGDTGGDSPAHPVIALIRKWLDRSRDLKESLIFVSGPARGTALTQNFSPIPLVGQAVLREDHELEQSTSLEEALLPVAKVDGEVVAAQDHLAEPNLKWFYRPEFKTPKTPYRNSLFQDRDTEVVASNVILASLSNYPLNNPKRVFLRSDIYKIGAFIFLFPHRVRLPFRDASKLVMGKTRDRRNLRVNEAIDVLSKINFIYTHRKVPINVPLITYDADVTGEQPIYILGRGESFSKTVAAGYMPVSPQWSLTGLFSRHLKNRSGGIERLINGLELVLVNSRFTRRGPNRSFSEFLEPVDRKTAGPGKVMRLTWEEMMFASGEFIGHDEVSRRKAYQNWHAWMNSLEEQGYFCPEHMEAEAGDTVEIVGRIRAKQGQQAGALIRASARFTEAVSIQKKGKMETITAEEFLKLTLA